MTITTSFFVSLSLLLAAAKLFVGYDISWFWVFVPVTVPFVIAFVFFMVVAVIAYKKEQHKSKPLYPWNK